MWCSLGLQLKNIRLQPRPQPDLQSQIRPRLDLKKSNPVQPYLLIACLIGRTAGWPTYNTTLFFSSQLLRDFVMIRTVETWCASALGWYFYVCRLNKLLTNQLKINIHCEPKKNTQNVFSYLMQNPVDSDKIWYTLSWINWRYSSLNVFQLTWIL